MTRHAKVDRNRKETDMKRILTILSVVWASGAFAYNAGETFTVPSGATVTVTDADIADFNALASVTFADAGGFFAKRVAGAYVSLFSCAAALFMRAGKWGGS